MREIIEYKTKELLFILHKLKGSKIATITLSSDDIENRQMDKSRFDISEKGIIGYSPTHEKLFFERIALGIEEGGGLIIRQFLDEKIEHITNIGKKIKIPLKNIYGIYLGNDSYKILNSEEVKSACNTDYKTKERLLEEEGVFYKELEIDLFI